MLNLILSPSEIIDANRKAFSSLDDTDKEVIMELANSLRDKIRAKNPNVRFGIDSALELLAALGIAINDNRIRFSKD